MNRFAKLRTAIESARTGLEKLNRFTDSEFDALGRKLVQISANAKSIGEESSAAAGMLSGEDFRRSVDSLDRIPAFVESLPRGHARGKKTLDDVLVRLETCRRMVGRFAEFVLVLKVLALHMRSEAAWLRDGEVDFGTVADEVGHLALEIDKRSNRILEESSELARLIRRTLSQLLDLSGRQEQEISTLLAKSRESIVLFARAGSDSAHAAEEIATHYQDAYASVCEVARSIQFQDIVRQQIEHVQEGLTEVDDMLLAATSRRWLYNRAKLARAAHLCAVQMAQLENSRQILVSAVTRIIDRLGSVAKAMRDISAAPVALAEAGERRKPAFLAASGEHIQSILQVLQLYSASSSEVSAVINQVAARIAETSEFADQIEDITRRMRLASLNAQVKAAHLGGQGAALGILAERIQEVTDNATTRTTEVAGQLRLLAGEVGELSRVSATADSAGSAVAIPQLSVEVGGILQTLSNHDRVFHEKMSVVDDACGKLRNDLGVLGSSIRSHQMTDETLERVLSQIGDPLSALLLKYPTTSDLPAHLESHAERYTMSSEREVHQHLDSQGGPPLVPALAVTTSAPSSTNDEDLGDNVELF